MSKYKYLVVSDLDGTLLNSQGSISLKTKEYIRALKKREDVLFSFSTGRGWDKSEYIYKELEMEGFVACCNGSHIIDPHRNINLYSFLSPDIFSSLMKDDKFFQNLGEAQVYTDQGIVLFGGNDDRFKVLREIEEKKRNIFGIKFFIHKTGSASDNEDVEYRLRSIKNLPSRTTMVLYNRYSLEDKTVIDFEIYAYGAHKGRVLDFMKDYYGIPDGNVIAFGDHINDLPASHKPYYFVAVKNGVELLKCSSRKVSEFTNDEDSVVEEIELFLNRT